MKIPYLTDPEIDFRPMTHSDLDLVVDFMSREHVVRWWFDEQPVRERFIGKINGSERLRPWLVLHRGAPVGYVQDYLLGDHPDYALAIGVEPSAVSLDLFIAEPGLVGKGFGPRVIERFCDLHIWTQPTVTGVTINPNPSNTRAVRAFEKAGLEKVGHVDLDAGPEVVMYRPRPEALVLCIRHGQSEGNQQNRWQGQTEWALTSRGRDQALRACERLAGFTGPVYTSPLGRCVETASIISSELGLGEPEVFEPLIEIDVGDFSGLTHDEASVSHPDAYAKWKARELMEYPSGESRQAHSDRMVAAITDLGRRHPGRKVMAVTHGGSLSALERACGVWTRGGNPNLAARWYSVDPVEPRSERLRLIDDADTHFQR